MYIYNTSVKEAYLSVSHGFDNGCFARQSDGRASADCGADDDRKWSSSDGARCAGGVALVADATAQLRHIFPRVQHAVWNAPAVERVSEWNGGIRFRCRETGPDSVESGPESVIAVRVDTEGGKEVDDFDRFAASRPKFTGSSREVRAWV